jgi:predicted molibdopterin-dependent oxidoreductase YjgC
MSKSLRLKDHPVLDFSSDNQRPVIIFVDGIPMEAIEGEMLAAALWANNVISLGNNPDSDTHRGMYCGVGHCYECRVTVDGIEDVRSCLTPVYDGMRILIGRIGINKEKSSGI